MSWLQFLKFSLNVLSVITFIDIAQDCYNKK